MTFARRPGSLDTEILRTDSHGNDAHAPAGLRNGALHADAESHTDQPSTCPARPSSRPPSLASAQTEFWDSLTCRHSDLADPSLIH